MLQDIYNSTSLKFDFDCHTVETIYRIIQNYMELQDVLESIAFKYFINKDVLK